jgi:hypothetical protein
MQITYDSTTYTLDLEEIDNLEAHTIKRYAGLTLAGLEKSLAEGDVDGLQSLFWLMLHQSGENHNIERVRFKPLRFAMAIGEAQEAEKAARGEVEDDEAPKARKAPRSRKSPSEPAS